jgi:hypothetical protein
VKQSRSEIIDDVHRSIEAQLALEPTHYDVA